MKNKAIAWTTIALVGVVFVCLAVYFSGPAQQKESTKVKKEEELPDAALKDEPLDVMKKRELPDAVFKDEPTAHALYDKMIQTLRDANGLYFKSDYRWEARGRELGHATYRAWLKKPNHFRLEASRFDKDVLNGILVGDGKNMWIYWPDGKPRYGWEHSGEYGEWYEKHRSTSYMTKPTPQGRHSIGHMTGKLGAGMSMTILDLSTFHGYTDSLQKYLDGVRHMGTETMGKDECDVIEVSFMKHQRSWYLWLSKNDHLPRKLKEVVRVAYDIVKNEVWSDITISGEIPDNKFVWSPPTGWKEWKMPPIEEGLLKPGTQAPDFKLASRGGKSIQLSDFRGNFVWMYKWRAG